MFTVKKIFFLNGCEENFFSSRLAEVVTLMWFQSLQKAESNSFMENGKNHMVILSNFT